MRHCSQALQSTVGSSLKLPVFPHVPFLVCDLACLACTFQIKVVSTFLHKGPTLTLGASTDKRRLIAVALLTVHDSVLHFCARTGSKMTRIMVNIVKPFERPASRSS